MDDIQKLVRQTLAGGTQAWRSLQTQIEPTIVRIAKRNPSLRRKGLADLPDDLAEIRTATLERLARDNFASLRSFVERAEHLPEDRMESFDAWLFSSVDLVVREHLRRRFGRAPKKSTDEAQRVQPSKRDLQSRAGRFDEQPERALLQAVSVTMRLTIAEVLAYIDRAFSEREAQAARSYFVEGHTYEELAEQLELASAKEAEQLIRRLNARLRYRFLTPGDAQDD